MSSARLQGLPCAKKPRMTQRLLIPALCAFTLLAAPVAGLAGTPPQETGQEMGQTADPVAELLRQKTGDDALEQKGETYHRAPDAEQDPAEMAETDRLNTDIAARNFEADQIDASARSVVASDEDAYSARMAAYDAEVARINADNATREEAAAMDRDRYAKEMADWRATVAACNRGDTVRCRAGSMPARPGV